MTDIGVYTDLDTLIEKISTFSGSMLIFLDKWHEIDKKTERPPFQGFTYRTPEVV